MESHHGKRQKVLLERCAANSLRLTNILTGQQIYAFCQRRKICRRCAEYYRYCVARRLNTVEWRAHVVLTMKPGEDSPTPCNLRHQATCWQTLVSQLRKQFPGFYYAWFREIGSGGRLHLHVLWSIPSIEKNLLCSMATQAGFGHVNIQSTRTSVDKPQLAIINYVTKSLAKISSDREGAWLRGTRRHQISAPVERQGPPRRVWLPTVRVP